MFITFLCLSLPNNTKRNALAKKKAVGLYFKYARKSPLKSDKTALVVPQAGQGKPKIAFIGQVISNKYIAEKNKAITHMCQSFFIIKEEPSRFESLLL